MEEYLEKKEKDKQRYLSLVMSKSMGMDEEVLKKEALEKFEEEYPEYIDRSQTFIGMICLLLIISLVYIILLKI